MASIKDVANKAGVSVASVSRVINGSGAVSDNIKKNVLDAVEELGYKTNIFGKSLRTGGTKIIMVMLSSLSNTFCSSVIRSIDKASELSGYYTMVCATGGNVKKEEYYINFALNGIADGIIILNSSLTEEKMAELSKKIPVVQCNEFSDTKCTPYVSVDNQKAAYDATQLLISNGNSKIAFYTVDNDLASTKGRYNGYVNAIADNDIPFDDNLILYGNYGYRNAIRVFEDFINTGIEFDSIFAVSDRMAAGAVRVLIENGYSVPDDIEVIGFDNTDISYTTSPKLTTVSQPHFLLGKYAFEQLESLMQKKSVKNIIVPHKIIVRESTK